MKNILIVSGHTDLNDSFANRKIIEKLQKLIPQAEFDLLDKLYPDYRIDVKKEQKKLIKADVIVLQFPTFWYSCPSIMRRWFEDVLVYGFSHGSTGKALAGKKLLASFTTGSPAELYQHGALQNYTIDEFLPPFKQLANLCSMEWVDNYIWTDGVSYSVRNDENKIKEMEEKVAKHVDKLVDLLNSL